MNRCRNCGLCYINNNDIKIDFLPQDGLHVNDIGKISLANNFLNFINRYILWNEEAWNDSDNC